MPASQKNDRQARPQAHPWHGIPTLAGGADVFNAFIEIVPADSVKFELDKLSGHLRLDRPQRFSSQCPALYGFVPRTYCGELVAARCGDRSGFDGIQGDGDPMDICVLTEKQVSHGNFLVHARPIGGLRMVDGSQADDKIIAVLEADLAYDRFRDVADCPPPLIERLRHYFLTYKQRPDDRAERVRLVETYGREEALEMLSRSVGDYERHWASNGAARAEAR
jgi:inorganic pyrophosphatase